MEEDQPFKDIPGENHQGFPELIQPHQEDILQLAQLRDLEIIIKKQLFLENVMLTDKEDGRGDVQTPALSPEDPPEQKLNNQQELAFRVPLKDG